MTAIEKGCPYVINVGGLKATFNVPTDPDFVGYLQTVTGLDMYGVRENAQVTAAGDGGYHGPFWRDRRPWTLTGFIMPITPVSSRDIAQDKLLGVLGGALRSDGLLLWTPLGDGIQRQVNFRLQQRVTIGDGQSNQQKVFQIAGVSRDWRVIKQAGSSASAALGGGGLPLTVATVNGGNADAAPIITITGPINQPIVTQVDTLKKMTFLGNVGAGQSLVVNLQGVYPSIQLAGDWSNNVDPINSDYTIAAPPGGVNKNWQLSSNTPGTPGTSAATALQIQWHDSWH